VAPNRLEEVLEEVVDEEAAAKIQMRILVEEGKNILARQVGLEVEAILDRFAEERKRLAKIAAETQRAEQSRERNVKLRSPKIAAETQRAEQSRERNVKLRSPPKTIDIPQDFLTDNRNGLDATA
jgi:hypothetical protein